MFQTDSGQVFNNSKDPLGELFTGTNKSSKIIFQIDTAKGEVKIKIDKSPAKLVCTQSELLLDKKPLYLVAGLFFKKDRLKLKNVDKLIEKIENKVGNKLQALIV